MLGQKVNKQHTRPAEKQVTMSVSLLPATAIANLHCIHYECAQGKLELLAVDLDSIAVEESVRCSDGG